MADDSQLVVFKPTPPQPPQPRPPVPILHSLRETLAALLLVPDAVTFGARIQKAIRQIDATLAANPTADVPDKKACTGQAIGTRQQMRRVVREERRALLRCKSYER